MPVGPIKTKKQKQNVVHTELHKFKHGELHSGSKKGPIVSNPKQAIAIALSESGQSKSAKQPHPKTNPGSYQNDAHSPEGGYLRKGEEFYSKEGRPARQEGDGWNSYQSEDPTERMQSNLLRNRGMQPTMNFRTDAQSQVSSYRHTSKDGALRLSGNKNAHRIGGKR